MSLTEFRIDVWKEKLCDKSVSSPEEDDFPILYQTGYLIDCYYKRPEFQDNQSFSLFD